MPYINEDGTKDEIYGAMYLCDGCGVIEKIYDNVSESYTETGEEFYRLSDEVRRIFKGTRGHGLNGVYCPNCTRRLMPWMHRIRDVIELDIFVNRLQKVIHEKARNRN